MCFSTVVLLEIPQYRRCTPLRLKGGILIVSCVREYNFQTTTGKQTAQIRPLSRRLISAQCAHQSRLVGIGQERACGASPWLNRFVTETAQSDLSSYSLKEAVCRLSWHGTLRLAPFIGARDGRCAWVVAIWCRNVTKRTTESQTMRRESK